MKHLYLIRHGEAEDKGTRPDFDRNLTNNGRDEVSKTALDMIEQKIQPALIISSPATRALQTATIVADTIGYPAKDILKERDIYYTEFHKLIEILHDQDDQYESILLAGHNPSISQLAGMLANDSQEFLPTGGLVAFEIDSDNWNHFEKTKIRLLLSIFP
jgi:phosphohistidine phosphatase